MAQQQHDSAALQAVRDYPEYGGLEVAPSHDQAPEVVQPYPDSGVTASASPFDYKVWAKTGQDASAGQFPPTYHNGLDSASAGGSPYSGYASVPGQEPSVGGGAGSNGKGTRVWGLPRRVFWILVGVVAGVVVLAVALGAGLGVGLQHSSSSSAAAAAASTSSTASPTATVTTTASASSSSSTSSSSTSSTLAPYVTGSNSIPAPSATVTLKSTLDIACPADNLTLYKDTTENKTFILLCGRDYNVAGGSVDLANQNSTSMAECIGICAGNDTCTAAGWGFYNGADVCWLKSSIDTPNDSASWYFAIEESGANL